MIRRTLETMAVVAVSIMMMAGPSAAVVLSGDDIRPPETTTPDTTTTTTPRTVVHVMSWSCPRDTDIMTADGVCHDLERLLEQWYVDNGPVHPADVCREDESWTAVDYRSPDGIEDIHGVTRACRPVDGG